MYRHQLLDACTDFWKAVHYVLSIERCIKDKSPGEKIAARKELATPIWDQFWEFVDSLHPVGGSKLLSLSYSSAMGTIISILNV